MTLLKPGPTAAMLPAAMASHLREALERALADPAPDADIARIASRLGLVGDRTDLAPILAAAQKVTGSARDRVTFAAVLIAARFGLHEPAQRFPRPDETVEPDGEVAAITSVPATDDDRSTVLDGLRREPAGISSESVAVSRVDCGGRTIFVTLDNLVLTTPSRLADAPALVGVVAELTDATGQASPGMLVISQPAPQGFEVLVSRVRGEPLYRGSGTIAARGVVGTLAAVEAIGVAAATIAFEVVEGGLRLTGRTSTIIRNRRHPTPVTGGPARPPTPTKRGLP